MSLPADTTLVVAGGSGDVAGPPTGEVLAEAVPFKGPSRDHATGLVDLLAVPPMVAFRSAKGGSFAERKATITARP